MVLFFWIEIIFLKIVVSERAGVSNQKTPNAEKKHPILSKNCGECLQMFAR